jgi:hypothetical protein
LFAAIASGDHLRERLEVWRRYDGSTMGQIGVETGLRRVPGQRGRSLFHAERIGAVLGDLDPGQRGNLSTLCRAMVSAVPEHVEPRRVLPTFGHKTRGTGQDGLVVGRDDLAASGVVEADTIHSACKPAGKGLLGIRTISTQVTEGHSSWHQQQHTHHMTQKFLLGFLGVVHPP